jgi:hypothetical protein
VHNTEKNSENTERPRTGDFGVFKHFLILSGLLIATSEGIVDHRAFYRVHQTGVPIRIDASPTGCGNCPRAFRSCIVDIALGDSDHSPAEHQR